MDVQLEVMQQEGEVEVAFIERLKDLHREAILNVQGAHEVLTHLREALQSARKSGAGAEVRVRMLTDIQRAAGRLARAKYERDSVEFTLVMALNDIEG